MSDGVGDGMNGGWLDEAKARYAAGDYEAAEAAAAIAVAEAAVPPELQLHDDLVRWQAAWRAAEDLDQWPEQRPGEPTVNVLESDRGTPGEWLRSLARLGRT